MTGAMACSAVPRSVAFAAGPPGVPAWSIPRPSSASNICRTEAPLYRVGVKDIMPIVAFMAAWLSPAMLGSYRSETARIFAHDTTSVGALWETASRLGVAILVRSRRSAAKLSWRRRVLKSILNLREYLSRKFDSIPSCIAEMDLFFEYENCVVLATHSQEIMNRLRPFLDT